MLIPNFTQRYYTDHTNLYSGNQPPSLDPRRLDFMFREVKNKIRQLLESITLIYNNYGIVHHVHNYFDAILRLLTPVELNAVVNFDSVKSMFLATKDGDTNNGLRFNQSNMKMKTQSKNESIGFASDQFQTLKNDIQKRVEGREQFIVRPKLKDHTRPYGKTGARHTIRSRGLQDQILLWITSELQNGKIISKVDVMNKGRQLGKNFQFKACPRWCDNFLNRNPQVKKEIYKRLYVKGTYKKRSEIAFSQIGENQSTKNVGQQSQNKSQDEENYEELSQDARGSGLEDNQQQNEETSKVRLKNQQNHYIYDDESS